MVGVYSYFFFILELDPLSISVSGSSTLPLCGALSVDSIPVTGYGTQLQISYVVGQKLFYPDQFEEISDPDPIPNLTLFLRREAKES